MSEVRETRLETWTRHIWSQRTGGASWMTPVVQSWRQAKGVSHQYSLDSSLFIWISYRLSRSASQPLYSYLFIFSKVGEEEECRQMKNWLSYLLDICQGVIILINGINQVRSTSYLVIRWSKQHQLGIYFRLDFRLVETISPVSSKVSLMAASLFRSNSSLLFKG